MESAAAQSAALTAQQQFAENLIFWPMPLIDFLENKRPKLSLGWALEVFRGVSALGGQSAEKEMYCLWLDELEKIIGDAGLDKGWEEKAWKIWNHSPEFDSFERAVSRLHLANEAFHNKSPVNFRGSVAGAISMLSRKYEKNNYSAEPSFDPAIRDLALNHFHQFSRDSDKV